MSRARRKAQLVLLGGAIALAGCTSNAPPTAAQEVSANQANTLEADLRAAEARGAANALSSIAEADAELNRQVRSTAGSETYEIESSDLEGNAR